MLGYGDPMTLERVWLKVYSSLDYREESGWRLPGLKLVARLYEQVVIAPEKMKQFLIVNMS